MTIIVLLILAGVSLNAIIGDNGIITQAINAKEKSELAEIAEELEMLMMDFNMRGNTGTEALKDFMKKQVENGKITSFKSKRKGGTNIIQYIIEKDGHIFYAVPDGEYWKVVSTDGGTEVGGIEVQVYTQDNVTEDKSFELGNSSKETEVIFYDKIDGDLNFEIKEGIVSIYVYNDMKLTNSGMGRSAVDIHPGATLNLYLEKEDDEKEAPIMIVDSGYGEKGDEANGLGAKGGPRRICRCTCTKRSRI